MSSVSDESVRGVLEMRAAGDRYLLGGVASLRKLVDSDWDSYSREVLRGTGFGTRLRRARQALLGSMSIGWWDESGESRR